MKFRNKVSDYATVDKKGNMVYWDTIDNLAEDYLRKLLELSCSPLRVDTDENEDDVFLEVGKYITELAVKALEERLGAHFPYIDENY